MQNKKLNVSYSLVLYLFVFITPFLNGLFFERWFYPSFIVLLFVYIYILLKNKNLNIDRKLSVCFLANIAILFISVFNSINREYAIYSFFKSIFPFIIFLIFINMIIYKDKDKEDKFHFKKSIDTVFLSIFISGSFVALINLLFASVYFDTNPKLPRLEFVISYANTQALFFFICSIIGLYLLQLKSHKKPICILMKTGIFLNISCMILTFSRSLWVLSLLLYITHLIVSRNLKTFFDFIFTFVISVLNVFLTLSLEWNIVWALIIFSAILIYLSEKLYGFLGQKIDHLYIKKNFAIKTLLSLIVLVLGICSIFLIKNSEVIYLRLMSININASEFQERLAYYIDSIKIINDYPLFGLGGGGWASIQYHYQTALYAVKYAHSSIVQTTLDYGITGLIIFLIQIFLFFYYLAKASKKNKDGDIKKLLICSGFVNVAILLHSLIDLDFEFPIISMVLWINIAIVSVFSDSIFKLKLDKKKIKGVLITSSVFLIALQIPLSISSALYWHGINSYREKNYIKANELFTTSSYFNPFSSNVYFMKGETLKIMYSKNKDENIRKQAMDNYNLARKHDGFNPNYPAALAYISRMADDYENSIIEYKNLIYLHPLAIEYYEALAKTLFKKAESDYNNGMTVEALDKFKEIIAIEDEINLVAKRISHFGKYKSKHKTDMSLTPDLIIIIDKAHSYVQKINS